MDESKQFESEFADKGVPIPPEVLERAPMPEKDEKEEEDRIQRIRLRDVRRIEEKLQESREMNIALNERVKALSESDRFKEEVATDDDVHAMLFGNAAKTEATEATAKAVQRVLEKNKRDAADEAYNRALTAYREEQESTTREVEENTNYLNDELENIETRFGIDLSGETEESKKVRNGFIDFVARLSRKDGEGNIVDYPDIQATWEEYNTRRERSTSRNKQVASRSMTPSAGGDASTDAEKKALEKYMLEKGFI